MKLGTLTYRLWFFIPGMLLLLAFLPRCVSMHMSDKKVQEYFKDAPYKPTFP